MIITKKKEQDLPKIHLKVDNEEIEQTTCLKLSGVAIDHQLSFSEHVKHISVKAGQKIGVLLRMKHLILESPEKAKLHIFKTDILPHLTYCSTGNLLDLRTSENLKGCKRSVIYS